MLLPLDFGTQSHALRVARRLATGKYSIEGWSLLRELIAGMADEKKILALIEAWAAAAPHVISSIGVVAQTTKLPGIIETFAKSGYGSEAIRLMATGAGLHPAMTRQFLDAARPAFQPEKARIVSPSVNAAAQALVGIGMDMLQAGRPEGITLMGTAHNAVPQINLPFAAISRNLDKLQTRPPASLGLKDARALTNAAYNLHFSGRQDPAVRVGALVPAMVANLSAEHVFDRLQPLTTPGSRQAFQTSRAILDKGYASEAANLLVDSGAASADQIWNSLHEEIGTPAIPRVVAPSAVAPEQPPLKPEFFFVLEGQSAHNDQVLFDHGFDLVFCYDIMPIAALAGVHGSKLDPVVRGKVRLGVEVIPKGLILVSGGIFRLVTFTDGKMDGDPPRFSLKAPARDDAGSETDPVGVYVTFSIDGAGIYNFFLPVRLVDSFSDAAYAPRSIDLDLKEVAAAKVDYPRFNKLVIISQGDSWTVSGEIDRVDIPGCNTTILSAAKLADSTKDIAADLDKIAADAVWKSINDKLEVDPEEHPATRACMQKAMTAGYRLYHNLSQDPAFAHALQLIEKLPDGSIITVKTDTTAFPWEILYPLHYIDDDEPQNYQPGKFWGQRFLIESLLLATTEDEKIPSDHRQKGKLHVSMGVGSFIDKDWSGRPLLPVGLQHEYFQAKLQGRGDYIDKYKDILAMIRRADRTSLIYLFCHGSAEKLQFDAAQGLVAAINVEGCPSYPGWPIVFVNACSAANVEPLSFLSFRTEFRKRRAAGMIAPSFSIPTLFAALFARTFLDAYAAHQPVGLILFNLRRDLLARGNPLGLWYSLQCPMDVVSPAR